MKNLERQISSSGKSSIALSVDLFKKGAIDTLIKELELYKSKIPDMMELFVRRLAESGLRVAKQALSNALGDSSRDYELYIEDAERAENAITMRIHFDGERVLMWEFGAGIFYNSGKEHPKAKELGYGVGTYPNQTHAFQDGWFYKSEDGKLHYSHGTEAAMPLYKAVMEMIQRADRIAEGAFW